jgi:hypothetical protein
MNVYVKDSQISADLSTLSATGKAQKGKKFFVDLLMCFPIYLGPIITSSNYIRRHIASTMALADGMRLF